MRWPQASGDQWLLFSIYYFHADEGVGAPESFVVSVWAVLVLLWIDGVLSAEFFGDPDDECQGCENFPAEEFDAHDP
jgi:hypothetical protein